MNVDPSLVKLKPLHPVSLIRDSPIAMQAVTVHSEKLVNTNSAPELILMASNHVDQGNETLIEEASGSESEAEDDGPSIEHLATDRRRIQKATFESWVSKKAERLLAEESVAVQKTVDEEIQSAKYLMAQQESEVIITDPREYQLELFEKAKQQNTIAVLDTGSGKTLIAALLLKHVLDQELEDRGTGKVHRTAFFLVDCVTLVFQQYAVLECNLDQPIERFCGDMGCPLWNRQTWEKHFKENMVIVCTAEVLLQCLMHGFISMDRINLLIFDEAHHAKKNHPYARIIKDFYLAESDVAKRPNIFGMTASPVDAKVDVVDAAKELEVLLHSQIVTASDLTLLQNFNRRPVEVVAEYDPLECPRETSLLKELKSRFESLEIFSKTFTYAKQASSDLGLWCSDQIWSFAFADEEARKLESKVERTFLAKADLMKPVESLDSEIALLREAGKVVSQHTFDRPTATAQHLSSKVLMLYDILLRRFERPGNHKCIIFVKQRHTARLLSDLFKRIGSAHMRIGTLIGTRQGEVGDISVSFKQQVVALMRFRKGLLNCLFATSIAEEGLDIPDCNLVIRFNPSASDNDQIRFDLYTTLIQYVQSRGRARHINSKYVHMVEKHNRAHAQVLDEDIMRNFCQSLPADRLLQGSNCTLEAALSKERFLRTFTDKDSKAKLTYGSSMAVLAHCIACFPHEGEMTLKPIYVISFRDKLFTCEVVLPEALPFRSIVGRPASKKSIAKQAAAFEACKHLRSSGYLDADLLPTYHKQLPAMRNAQLALDMKSSNSYGMRTKPGLWASAVGESPVKLYATVLELAIPDAMGKPSQPLALLTRTELPTFPSFPVHFDDGAKSDVCSTSLPHALGFDQECLALFMAFTLRIFGDLFNKIYEPDASQLPYLLAPVRPNTTVSSATTLTQLLDWDTLKVVRENESLSWDKNTPSEFFANRFVVDRWDGGRRFFTIGVNPDLKPLDPVPSDSASGKYMGNILQYSNSLWKRSRSKVTFQEEQPVVVAHRVLHRRNLLDEITEKEKCVTTKCYICPEPLKISALPTKSVAMAYLLPAIMFRFDSYLVALEACESLHLDVRMDLALEALTKDSDNTEEHREEQISFQRGMGSNYERLEFLGDCFLKMATSIALYSQNPDNDEYQYHVKRMLLICNKNLFQTATKHKLHEFIRSKSFSRRVWYPEEPKLLQGKGVNKGREIQRHILGDKTVADVCEAIIGAAYLSHLEKRNFDVAVRAVTELVCSSDHNVLTWDDYYKSYQKPAYQTAQATQSQLNLAEQVEKKHDYRFRYPRLLRSAFIHPSYPFLWEKVPCYQRLEFLGDSLLDMACVNFLYQQYPDRDPQWLTEHKMAMVSNKFLGALCVRLGFHKHLRYNGTLIEHQIRNFVEEIQETEREAQGAPDYWVHAKSSPKALPDIVEAYVGAIFVDSEFCYAEVERFFDAHIRPFFTDMTIYDTFANNHPTTLLTKLLTITLGCTSFRILASEIPALPAPSSSASTPVLSGAQTIAAVMVHNEIVAEGRAASTKNARVKASGHALKLLDGLERMDFRKRFGCDCAVAVEVEERSMPWNAGYGHEDGEGGDGAMGNDVSVDPEKESAPVQMDAAVASTGLAEEEDLLLFL
ncbi:MAG: Dicer-like protein 1 [Piccolia ochrophora]|nr:MAG: Dicer-like protein 1 [Piccolia ochrophora]